MKTSIKGALSGLFLLALSSPLYADQYGDALDSARADDYHAAFYQLLPLAQQGDARAQFNIALMYHSGLFVERSESKAMVWYQKAAQNGHPIAQEYMTVGYKEGWFGLPHDEVLAAYWQNKLNNNEL